MKHDIDRKRQFQNDRVYDYLRSRTGLFARESKKFVDNVKLKTITNFLDQSNISYEFDVVSDQITRPRFTITGTNYGPLFLYMNPYFYNYLIYRAKDKHGKLIKNIDIDVQLNDRIFKYENNSQSFNQNIKKLVVLSSATKHKIIDWNILNEIMTEDGVFLKFHPILDIATKKILISKYGIEKTIESNYLLDPLIEKAEEIAFTGCTESMITSGLLNKKLIFLHKPDVLINGVYLTYYYTYNLLYHNYNIKDIINTGYTGLIPWKYINDISFIKKQVYLLVREYDSWRNMSYNRT